MRFNKVIGVGLHNTGINSLFEALHMLGLNVAHYHPERAWPTIVDPEAPHASPFVGAYDDVDASVDLPGCMFGPDITEVYPGSAMIATVREVDPWWQSVKWTFTTEYPLSDENTPSDFPMREMVTALYGTSVPVEWLWKRSYQRHYLTLAMASNGLKIPMLNFPLIAMEDDDRWRALCSFLDIPTPRRGTKFPDGRATRHAIDEDEDVAMWTSERFFGKGLVIDGLRFLTSEDFTTPLTDCMADVQ